MTATASSWRCTGASALNCLNTNQRDPNLIQLLIVEGRKLFEQIEKPEPQCVVSFFIKPYITSHLGFMLDDRKFIHIMFKSRVTVEKIDCDDWKNRITVF